MLLLMGLVLLSACDLMRAESAYRVSVPILMAHPLETKCILSGMESTCVCYVKSDAETIIRRLKAACLALGGNDEECQTSNP